ncbi:hypothetical protein GCM10023094_11110 [Rhodococcus olei]|uniref:Uncharacterized protein n=1 Tax=Rhodococcus olei TaxID=2161675 RepID=A0ABP8NVB7_9NOCA
MWGRRNALCERDVEDVVGVEAVLVDSIAIPCGRNVGAISDYAFGEKKSVCEFDVVSRGAHGDRKRRSRDADLEWFFDDECVGP